MNKLILSIISILIVNSINGQITVAENTLKVGGLSDEVFYYGFAEGDQLIFDFEEMKGKPLKEIEISEYPNSSKYMDYKSKSIENKIIQINKSAIYKFRFSNSAIGGRICKFKIQRIPGSDETKNFNTNVKWKTLYDTTKYTVNERYLVSRDTIVHNITSQNAKVHSVGNINGNRNSFNFTLPQNTYSWSYYIGVDQQGQQALEDATKKLSESATPLVSQIPGYGPLAALALEGTSYIAQLQKGEDIDYYLVDGNNVNLFLSNEQFSYLIKGKVINESRRVTNIKKGSYHFCLYNDNAITGVQVQLNITAIEIKENWGERPVDKQRVDSKKVPYLEQ